MRRGLITVAHSAALDNEAFSCHSHRLFMRMQSVHFLNTASVNRKSGFRARSNSASRQSAHKDPCARPYNIVAEVCSLDKGYE